MTPQQQQFRADLVERLPELRRHARKLLRGRADVDDLVQDAIVAALAHEASFAPGTNMAAWLQTILRNRIFLYWKDRRRMSVGTPVAWGGGDYAGGGRSGGQQPSAELADLSRGIAALPLEYSFAICRTALGCSYDEIALSTGIPAGSVKSAVSRGRAWLRRFIEGERPPAIKPNPKLYSEARHG